MILTDEELAEHLVSPLRSVEAMRAAIHAAHNGELLTPPRVHARLGNRRLTYTAGRRVGDWFGYRSYDTIGDNGDQIVAVHDDRTGRLQGLAVGQTLGHARVGAIGGVACDTLAPADATTLGLVGTGPQAWMQLWAIQAVRPLRTVRVHSRSKERRERFAADASERYGMAVTAVGTAEDAVADMELVVLATSSTHPVVDEAAVTADFMTTLGPKQLGRHEFPPALAQRFPTIATDSLAQVRDYDPPFILSDSGDGHRMVSLGSILDGHPVQGPALFCSVGLAGTEAWLLADLIDR